MVQTDGYKSRYPKADSLRSRAHSKHTAARDVAIKLVYCRKNRGGTDHDNL